MKIDSSFKAASGNEERVGTWALSQSQELKSSHLLTSLFFMKKLLSHPFL